MLSDIYMRNTPVVMCFSDKIREFKAIEIMKKKPFEGKNIDISLDQSSSNTGMSVWQNGMWLMSLQIKLSNHNSDTALVVLETFLGEFLNGSKVEWVIYEDTFYDPKKGHTVYGGLSKVKATIKNLKIRFKQFQDCKMQHIAPNSWRSGFITQGKQGKKRAEKKANVVKEAVRRLPILEKFAPYCGEDFDAIESFGIYLGWRAKNFSNGRVKIDSTLKECNEYTERLLPVPRDIEKELIEKAAMNVFNTQLNINYFETDLDAESTSRRIAEKYTKGVFKVQSNDLPWIALKHKTMINKDLDYYIIVLKIGALL